MDEYTRVNVHNRITHQNYLKTLTCLLKAAISSLKDSDEQTSAPCKFWSLGVHVANSHFSNTNANRGNSGWL